MRTPIEKWIKANKLSNKYRSIYNERDYASITITQSGHYHHEMTMHVACEYSGNNDKAYNTIDELGDIVLEEARNYAKEIYKGLEQEHEYLTSKESVEEALQANDYVFTKDGSRSIYL